MISAFNLGNCDASTVADIGSFIGDLCGGGGGLGGENEDAEGGGGEYEGGEYAVDEGFYSGEGATGDYAAQPASPFFSLGDPSSPCEVVDGGSCVTPSNYESGGNYARSRSTASAKGLSLGCRMMVPVSSRRFRGRRTPSPLSPRFTLSGIRTSSRHGRSTMPALRCRTAASTTSGTLWTAHRLAGLLGR